MKSQVNPVVAVVVIVIVVVAVLGLTVSKTGNNSKRLATGLDTSQMEKDPAGTRVRLADEIDKYIASKGNR